VVAPAKNEGDLDDDLTMGSATARTLIDPKKVEIEGGSGQGIAASASVILCSDRVKMR